MNDGSSPGDTTAPNNTNSNNTKSSPGQMSVGFGLGRDIFEKTLPGALGGNKSLSQQGIKGALQHLRAKPDFLAGKSHFESGQPSPDTLQGNTPGQSMTIERQNRFASNREALRQKLPGMQANRVPPGRSQPPSTPTAYSGKSINMSDKIRAEHASKHSNAPQIKGRFSRKP